MTQIAGVNLVDMKKSKESLSPSSVGKITPDPYSYDHRITLDGATLNKMKVGETPKVGDVFHVMGEGHVHSVDSVQHAGQEPTLRVGIQLRKMGVKKKEGTPADGAFAAVEKGIKDAGE
ncbi:MAG: hypothetical protein KGL39_14705 [Patescibacteria group bacterium]|nr:hypothetical protein [Patescibacteria group bacterium]